MTRKEKNKETEKEKPDKNNPEYYSGLQKIEAISNIDDLRIRAQNYNLERKFDEAIICADQIIRIAIQYNLSDYMKEQEEFINSIAKKVEKEYMISQIKEYTAWIQDQYDKLVNSDGIVQAHDLVESFRQRYKDLPYIDSIPEVEAIFKKDMIHWLKYNSMK